MNTVTKQVFSSCTPLVKSGETLKVTVNQTLEDLLDTAAPEEVQAVIEGPQVLLTPADIAGVYPAPGSDDSPDEFLPHVALARRTLPWERLGPDWKQPKPVAPWLALLLLRESEMKSSLRRAYSPGPAAGSKAVKDQKTFAAGPTIVPTKVKDVKDAAFLKVLRDKLKLTDETELQAIFIPNVTLKDILPSKDEIRWLCHMKRRSQDDVNEDVAIVVCNRLPYSGVKGATPELHTALLVSLEKRDDLIDPNYFTQHPTGTTGLIVLHHWTFTSSQQGDFEQVMHEIGYRPNGGVLRFGNLPWSPGPGTTGPLTAEFDAVLEANGYLREEIPNTQPGKVEYRGPLRPFAPPPRSRGFAVRPAPQEFADDATGTAHDYSHAAAFEIGRLLALADPSVLGGMRDIQLGGKTTWPKAAINKLPVALQKPEWVVNPAEMGDPWTPQIKGAAELRGPVEADFTGIAQQVAAWKDNVIQSLKHISAPQEAPVGQIDVGTFNGELLTKQFSEVINAAVQH